jgi:hypothetical protein
MQQQQPPMILQQPPPQVVLMQQQLMSQPPQLMPQQYLAQPVQVHHPMHPLPKQAVPPVLLPQKVSTYFLLFLFQTLRRVVIRIGLMRIRIQHFS